MPEKQKPNQKKPPKKPLIFPPGTHIEIRPEEEGFSGSWYEATVISPVPNPNFQNPNSQNSNFIGNVQNPNVQNPNGQNPNFQNNVQNPNAENPNFENSNITLTAPIQNPNVENPNNPNVENPNAIFNHEDLYYDVEYKNLLADDEKTLLIERVKADNIRPVPPVQNLKPDFRINDIIEAFHLDGWWIGVITKITPKNSKNNNNSKNNINNGNNNNNGKNDGENVYEVTFTNPPDLVEFRGSEMRVHFDWIDGKWVRPLPLIPNQSKSGEKSRKKNKRRQSKVLGENGGTENGLSSVMKTPLSRKSKTLATSVPTGTHLSKRRKTQNADSSSVSNEVTDMEEGKGLKEVYCNSKDGMAAGTYQCPSTNSSADTQPPPLLLAGIFLKSTVEDLPDSITANGSSFVEQAVISAAVVEGNRGEAFNPNNELETVEKAASVEQNDDKSIDSNYHGLESAAALIANTAVEVVVDDPNNEKEEMVERVSAVEGNTNPIDSDDRSLPFVKTFLPVWKGIESMEVFQAIPQKPHFQMLVNDRPESREIKAIGHMLTFSRVAKKITELQFDDPRGSIEDCLKDLVDLEKNGFDVNEIRDRVSSLLSQKDEHDNILNQLKEHENLLMEHNCEKGKILEQIGLFDQQIKELQEKRGLAFSMREDVETKIVCVELKLKSARQAIDNLYAFKKAAASR